MPLVASIQCRPNVQYTAVTMLPPNTVTAFLRLEASIISVRDHPILIPKLYPLIIL